MRLIFMMLIAAGGYHFVSQALSSRTDTTASTSTSATTLPSLPSLTSTDSISSWYDSLRSLVTGSSGELRSTFDTATASLAPQTRSTLSNASHKVTGGINIGRNGCGSADSDGNIKYCFNNEGK